MVIVRRVEGCVRRQSTFSKEWALCCDNRSIISDISLKSVLIDSSRSWIWCGVIVVLELDLDKVLVVEGVDR